MSLRRILFALLAFLPILSATGTLDSSPAWAANVYVRDGANGSGSDWSNALDQLPAVLVRGNIYYVADGAYQGRAISVPRDGTREIYIKKASVADHGTDIGWNSSYGDGTAVFGTWDITGNTGFITFDGSYKYGLRIEGADVPFGYGIYIRNNNSDSIPNITLKYIEVAGPGVGSERYPWINATRGIWIGGGMFQRQCLQP